MVHSGRRPAFRISPPARNATTTIAHDESYHFDTGRLEAFSDGVFAIAITLLILEIGVPHIEHGSELAKALLDEWPSFFGYGLSFIVIGIMWMNHHEMFRDIERVDHWLMVTNLLLLLTVAFIPFPTAVLAETLQDSDGLRTATLLYGGTFTVNAIFFNALWLHAVSRRTRRFMVGPAAYGITIPLAFVTPWASLALYVGYAVLYLLPSGD